MRQVDALGRAHYGFGAEHVLVPLAELRVRPALLTDTPALDRRAAL